MSYPRPLALLGEGLAPLLSVLARLPLERLEFTPVVVPLGTIPTTLSALNSLGFLGALIDPSLSGKIFPALERLSPAAKTCGAVDTLSLLGGEYQGGYALEEALRTSLENRGFRLYGAKLMVLGSGPEAVAAVQLARAGAARLVVAADTLPQAEAMARTLPATGGDSSHKLTRYAITLGDERLESLVERVDLVVQAGATLPPRLWQPYHTSLDLFENEGGRFLSRVGGQVLPFADVHAERLRLQLETVSGVRVALETVQAALGGN
ncbi:MAG: hypothetical protein H7095_01240 [Pseudopedobacter sp.]|nr:hypothetical protein [Deinococcales bacterium]